MTCCDGLRDGVFLQEQSVGAGEGIGRKEAFMV